MSVCNNIFGGFVYHFIKETNRKDALYYQIYEGHYDKEKGYSVQTSYKVLGYLSDLKSKGIDNPK